VRCSVLQPNSKGGNVNSIELARIEQRLRANRPKREQPAPEARETIIPGAVSGGFRAGKRKRGNSLLKRAPKTNAHAITFYIRDELGDTVDTVRTLSYKRK
jgi:hypothetical protein